MTAELEVMGRRWEVYEFWRESNPVIALADGASELT